MTHRMNLAAAPFEMIRSGRKTIELRLFDEKRRLISVGDTVIFLSNDGRELTAEVTSLHRFDSFAELYAALPLTDCGYTEDNVADAKPSDMDIYYSPEKQAEYGVVGIGIRLI